VSAHPQAVQPVSVKLEGELTIYRANELKPVLLAALDGAADVHFDLAGVSEIDTAGVQLLLLVRREAATRGLRLRLSSPSAAVRGAFELLELTAQLHGANLAEPVLASA